MKSKENIKFHSLNALRFFSFLIVFLNHSTKKGNFFHLKGELGVYFFFVLSGFLISYIILNEKLTTGTHNLKRFFIRRILRIWPMYFLILLFAMGSAFLIAQLQLPSSDKGYTPNWWVSFAFLENYRIMYFSDFANVSPLPVLWSVCIEEHFYIVWGLLIYFVPLKRIPSLMVTIIIGTQIARWVYWKNEIWFKDLITNFDFFMWGALLAWVFLFHQNKLVNFLNKIPFLVQATLPIVVILALFTTNYMNYTYQPLLEPLTFGLLFMALLLVFLPQAHNKLRIPEKIWVSKWGLYTYSLYLNHVIVVNLVLRLFDKMKIQFHNHTLIFILICLVMTLAISGLTYRLIEKPFLKQKKHFR